MSAQEIGPLLDRWVRPEIRTLSAYQVPDAGRMVNLDAMENPYTWPEALREEWAGRLRDIHVNRYPDPHALQLSRTLRTAMGIPADMGLLLGNGSDEIIQMLAMTAGGAGRTLLTVEPGFVMYRMIAQFTDMNYAATPLRATDFALDTEALLRAMRETEPAILFLAVPNNPTGNAFDAEDLVRVIRAAPGLVVIDEAYAPFCSTSFLPRLGEHPNLLVMRTVSKMGLAGLRLGLLSGPREWIDEIDKTRLPYNINVLTQVSATFALEHKALLDSQTEQIREDRARLFAVLEQLPGVTAYPSEANFILCRMPGGRGSRVFAGLKEHRILVKNLDGAHPLLQDCLRVTVGTAGENQAFLDALREVLHAG
jgi:histidinol-phosphate aminotransferase